MDAYDLSIYLKNLQTGSKRNSCGFKNLLAEVPAAITITKNGIAFFYKVMTD